MSFSVASMSNIKYAFIRDIMYGIRESDLLELEVIDHTNYKPHHRLRLQTT